MPKHNAQASKPATSDLLGKNLALIAREPSGEAIAAVLDAHGVSAVRYADAQELLSTDDASRPGAIVLSVGETDASMVELLQSLSERFEPAPIVLVCPDIERWRVRAALKAGAAGVVLEQRLDAALLPSLQAVCAGQTAVPSSSWRQIEPPVLSTRERQILGLVVMGYMNSEIAGQLYLAESTVKSHLSSAFNKLGVRSRNEAINLILDPERGLGTGILSLGVEPLEAVS